MNTLRSLETRRFAPELKADNRSVQLLQVQPRLTVWHRRGFDAARTALGRTDGRPGGGTPLVRLAPRGGNRLLDKASETGDGSGVEHAEVTGTRFAPPFPGARRAPPEGKRGE